MRHRWVICALLFAAATVNYIDRQVLAVLKPTLQAQLGWSEIGYGNIVTAFQAAYAVGLLFMGRFMDRVGTRAGFALSAAFWAFATAAHALAGSVATFAAARVALGLGEAGMFPAGARAVAEWFPRRERALALALFNAGTNVGPVLCPLMAPWLMQAVGWRGTFVVLGGLALAWVGPWLTAYRAPDGGPRRPARAAAVSWRALLAHRQMWAVALAKLITDPVWWLYLFWIPDFLHRNHGLDLKRMGPPVVAIYLLAMLGGVAGGWLSSRLLARGLSANVARKSAMLLAALAVVPVVGAARTTSLPAAVALIGLAMGAHQAFSANLLTLPSDLFPLSAVGTAVGLAGTAGALGGILIAQAAGRVLQATGSYQVLFAYAGGAYLAALGLIQVLSPDLDPVELAPS